MDQKYITQDTKDKFEKELLECMGVKRAGIAKKIAAAKVFGDLSENAEYAAAKEEHGANETRIAEIEYILKISTIYKKRTDNIVGLGSVVGLEAGKVQKEYTVVGFGESDPQKGKISHESPLGLALVGKTLGDTIELNLPSGTISYKVVRIE